MPTDRPKRQMPLRAPEYQPTRRHRLSQTRLVQKVRSVKFHPSFPASVPPPAAAPRSKRQLFAIMWGLSTVLAVALAFLIGLTFNPNMPNRSILSIDQFRFEHLPRPAQILPAQEAVPPSDLSLAVLPTIASTSIAVPSLTPLATLPPTNTPNSPNTIRVDQKLSGPVATDMPVDPPTPVVLPEQTSISQNVPDLPELGHLVIPALDIDQAIIEVPLEDGNWDVSDLDQQIGRLEGSGRFPGDEMGMTLVGHATTTWPVWGPFQRLNQLSLGAEISVDYGDQRFEYEITRFLYVDPQAIDYAFAADGDRLILLTCGSYNFVRGDYEERLVVQADLVSVSPLDVE